jgi:ribose transport system substrate-binding protein
LINNDYQEGSNMKKALALLLVMLVVAGLFAACGTPAESGKTSGDTFRVFLITMDQMDQHWKNVDAGCRRAADEIGGIEYQWTAPDVKDDAKQIEMINNAVANGANAILLAANGPEAVNDALKEASNAGVKIIYVDSPATFEPFVQTLSTNNQAAGKTAGDTMLDALADKGVTSGKIGVISVNASTDSTVKRDSGFRSAFEGTGFELLETQYSDGDAARSKDFASAFIVDGCVGIFGANEGCTVGVGNAIKEAGSNVVGVGFDYADSIKELISGGYLKATMVQNPDVMGYEGMKVAAAALKGTEPSEKVIDTGVSVVTAETLGGTASTGETYKVFLITMDQMDQYWTNVDAGCKAAADELGNVEYRWTAPDVKDDAKQIEMINNAVANGADVILLAANGPEAVNDALREAAAAGVKIVYVDSPATYEPVIQTLSTNNQAAGQTAGETMLAALTEKGITSGKIGVISVNASTDSTVKRDTGFRAAFEGKGFELLETQYSDGDAARSKDFASAFIVDGCVGIFGANEGCAVGVGNAIKEAGSGVIGVGFDNSDNIKELIKEGYLLATMVQNPYVMGYEGLKVAIAALKGTEPSVKAIDTGVSVVTAKNVG